MKTKWYIGRDYKGQFTCDGKVMKWYQVLWRQTKYWTKFVAISTVIIWAVGYIGFNIAKSTIEPAIVEAERIVEVEKAKEFPPMLERICKAESGQRQFNSSGRVLRGKVNPSDIGYCQINEPIWNDKARELGYDIYTEQGNKAMALWLFEHYGNEPWNSSKHIWNK